MVSSFLPFEPLDLGGSSSENLFPVVETLITLKSQLLQDYGSCSSSIATLASWNLEVGCLSANAYDHFRLKGRKIHWDTVVWEQWSLPKHCFVL